jgi:hypothetical protein
VYPQQASWPFETEDESSRTAKRLELKELSTKTSPARSVEAFWRELYNCISLNLKNQQ